MHTSAIDPNMVPVAVEVDDAMIRVSFNGGLQVATPTTRFPRLLKATTEQRKSWQLIGRGDGIHWPEIDEDISVKGLFSGVWPKPATSVEEIPFLIGELYKTTRRLNDLFQGRPFTPDGHLVGSIGEVVAEYIYNLKLNACSTPFADALTQDGRSVQIKLTGEKGTSYGIRWSNKEESSTPDLLLCLKLTSDGFSEIYNGPFPAHLLKGKTDQRNGQISLTVARLRALNPSVMLQVKQFTTINRWFAPPLSHVA